MADTTYQTKVYLKRGGDELVAASGGKINLEPGSEFTFYDTDFSVEYMKNLMKSLTGFTDYYRSGAVSFFNISQLATNYGYHTWSGDTTMSLGSVTLPMPDSGCVLWLNGSLLVGDANLSVNISTSTIMINQGSIRISSFELSANGYAKLICTSAECWAVVEANYTAHTEV